MAKAKESGRYFSLGVGTADIFFILLAFFLTLASPKDKEIFKLPLTAEKSEKPKTELNPWKMVIPPYDPLDGTVFRLESTLGGDTVKCILLRARVDTLTYDDVIAVFKEFIEKQKQLGVNTDSISAFDLFAYFGSPSGVVFTAIDVCKTLGKKTTLIYERKTRKKVKDE